MYFASFDFGAAVSLNPQPIPPGYGSYHPPSPCVTRGIIVIGG